MVIGGIIGVDGAGLTTFQESFTNTTTINITHNRGFIPQVTILNDTKQDITSGVAITHNDNNSFIVMSNVAITGTINY